MTTPDDAMTDKQILQESALLTNQLWKWTGIGTAVGVAVALSFGFLAKAQPSIPDGLIGTVAGLWFGALCGRSGFGSASFKDFRESDYELNRIKASAPAANAGQTVNVAPKADVQITGGTA